MRVALAHDFLVQYGGAERVLEVFCQLFPDAPIFSLFYDEQRTRGRFRGREIHTSFLSRLPLAGRRIGLHHHLFFWSFPFAMRCFDLSGFDLVLSSSASYSKGVRPPAGVPHVCYCYTPTRYLWDDVRHYVNGALASAPVRLTGEALFAAMRRWDRDAARRPTRLVAVSNHIAERIRAVYRREPDAVVFPPVDTDRFSPNGNRRGDYLLMVGRHLPYKRFDLGIAAANRLGARLKVVGVGRETPRLRALAGPTVEFVGWVSDEELVHLYRHARAVVFPQVEDFGLVAAEAIAAGAPLVAYRAGGATDIVRDGVNGVFFDRQEPDAVVEAIRRLECARLEPAAVSATAAPFERPRFVAAMRDVLDLAAGQSA